MIALFYAVGQPLSVELERGRECVGSTNLLMAPLATRPHAYHPYRQETHAIDAQRDYSPRHPTSMQTLARSAVDRKNLDMGFAIETRSAVLTFGRVVIFSAGLA